MIDSELMRECSDWLADASVHSIQMKINRIRNYVKFPAGSQI